MRFKGIVITLLAGLSIVSSCAEEGCPVAMKSSDLHYFKKKKVKYGTRKKPSPSLIHITRVNYKPGVN
jgi:hypothetical protein